MVERQDRAGGATQRRALGRGLESLLTPQPGPIGPAKATTEESSGRPLEVPTDLIDRNPFQTRAGFDEEKLKELAASIAVSGVVQPVVLRPGRTGASP